jgi:hypothetical protein
MVYLLKILFNLTLVQVLISCAGPTNPFGGEVFISEKFKVDNRVPSNSTEITMESTPDRQYYNSAYDLTVSIVDPNFTIKDFKYDVVYNNKKLNRWFKTEEIKFPKDKSKPIKITFKNLSILPGNINKIAFLYYPKNKHVPVIHNLEVPECYRNFKTDKINISPFKISNDLANNINSISKKYDYNSSLVAALIAQESSFNPKALSFAKALGLTQITPVAHEEITKIKKDWQIYPKFKKLPYLNLKTKVISSIINNQNDWRLDNTKSIEGGVLYLNYLNNYWSSPEKQEILSDVFKKDIPSTDIILASYNSGAYRVKKSIMKNREDWLFDKSLNEARKYVMNIKSYCYAFNQEKPYVE